jgi:NosR/NirI family transcriptional regulator, nitrous oxide reductase regulator
MTPGVISFAERNHTRCLFPAVLRLFIVLVALTAAAPLHAQAPEPDTAAAGADDGWNFEDEEEQAPTWADDLRAQALDLAAVAAFSVLALVSFFRKSVPLKVVTLAAAVAYLGFAKSQLISIVNVFGVLSANFPLFRHNLAFYLLAAIVLVTTVLWGRVYCGRMCAFGALTQLIDRVVPARWQYTVPRRFEQRAGYVKFAVLGGAVAYFLITGNPLIYRYVEPFWMFGLHATPALWVAVAVLLTASLFVRNLYCRFLCPVGATLGLISNLTVFRIKRWSECNTCRICEKTCEWGAIRGPKIVMTECVRCDDCERLYEDTKKCPHHLIQIYRSKKAALAGAGK